MRMMSRAEDHDGELHVCAVPTYAAAFEAEQDLTRWERLVANAQLVCFAPEGRKVSPGQIERITKRTLNRRRRRHLCFGG